jgi:hypothetical protein
MRRAGRGGAFESTGALLPVDLEDIVVLNVTRAAQAAGDLAAHIAAAEGYGLPDSLASVVIRSRS